MRLLFVTQKINEADDDLAFSILWVKAFERAGFSVSVICLEKGTFDDSFSVYSLGKEHGAGKIVRAFTFLKLVTTLQYDRVFVHMNPEYFALGGWWWVLWGIPTYLWYTHYTMTAHLSVAGFVARRLFAATEQSLPQYRGSAKRVIVGHGIDTAFWGTTANRAPHPHAILSVHRLSRSKRLERALQTLALLPETYTLTVYGRPIDPAYFRELEALVHDLHLESRVTFNGPVPMAELRNIYPTYRLMLNLASETIDKTMLEGMLFGVYPVTTPQNLEAIGLHVRPANDSPEELARFIKSGEWQRVGVDTLRRIVEERHSLDALMQKMSTYIKNGN